MSENPAAQAASYPAAEPARPLRIAPVGAAVTHPGARPVAPVTHPDAGQSHPGARSRTADVLSRGQRVGGYVLLAAVLGAVAAMSWSGLFGFATATMGWSPVHAALVPIATDLAALACAFLALDCVSKGELATGYRVMALCLVALSAFLNWRHAVTTGSISEQVFFPAMSVISYGLIHLTLGKYRRDAMRQRAGQAARQAVADIPRLGLAAWLPGIGYPGRAMGAVRASIAQRIPDAPRVTGPSHCDDRASGFLAGPSHCDDRAAGFLAGLSQSDAIREAIRVIGADNAREVVAWLSGQGYPPIPTSRVHDVVRRDRRERGEIES